MKSLSTFYSGLEMKILMLILVTRCLALRLLRFNAALPASAVIPPLTEHAPMRSTIIALVDAVLQPMPT
jgi:hypothetical protein